MDPSTNNNNSEPAAAGQPVNEPAYDPSQVSIVSAAEPRYGLAPEPAQYAATEAPHSLRRQLQYNHHTQPQQQPQPTAVYRPTVPPPVTTNQQPLAPPEPVGGVVTAAAPKAASTPQPKAKTNPNSTQNTLQIAEVRDGIVIMNDGSFRSVVMVKSINFDLMSQQEQEAVEYSYQGFLNSLYFQVQIFIRSRKVDLTPYIERLDKIRSEHDNMLLALLMEDYIQYMGELSQQTNIMDKNFYVVIPFFPVVEVQKVLTQNKNFVSGLTKLLDRAEQHVVINEVDLENAKTELRNRVQSVLAGLQQCGVQGLPLDTQELIELYYDSYNPDTATRQKLKDFGNLTADIVTKGQGVAPQAHLQRELQ